MITQWIRKKFAIRSSRKLVRMTKTLMRSKRTMLAPREAEQAQVRIDACEDAIRLNSLHEIRTSRKALAIFFEDNLSSYRKSLLRQNVEALIVAVVLALMIRSFIVQPFKIPSGSMIPTLLIGDHILINKFTYGTRIPLTDYKFSPFSEIRPGDIVVFKKPQPSGEQVFYVKRTIGVAGDEIDIRGRDIFINGKVVPQTYSGDYEYGGSGYSYSADRYSQSLSDNEFSVLYEKQRESTAKGNRDFPLVVPQDSIFVMGDNRDNSLDSRFWGFVPVKKVYGKVFIVHWSWNFSAPDLLDKVRWKRIFSRVR